MPKPSASPSIKRKRDNEDSELEQASSTRSPKSLKFSKSSPTCHPRQDEPSLYEGSPRTEIAGGIKKLELYEPEENTKFKLDDESPFPAVNEGSTVQGSPVSPSPRARKKMEEVNLSPSTPSVHLWWADNDITGKSLLQWRCPKGKQLMLDSQVIISIPTIPMMTAKVSME